MSDIRFGTKNVGSAVPVKKYSVGGNIKIAKGCGTVVNARWGQIEGNIEDQTDLVEVFGAITEDIATLNTELNAKANEADLEAVSRSLIGLGDVVNNKLTTPEGSEGQFMVYRQGSWVGEEVPNAEGVNF